MTRVLQRAADEVLAEWFQQPRVPGVVAIVTDRSDNIMKAQRASACSANMLTWTTRSVHRPFRRRSHDRDSRDAMCRGRQAPTSMLRRKERMPTSASFRCSMDRCGRQAEAPCAEARYQWHRHAKRRRSPASAMISSTRTTTGSPAKTASQASSGLRRRHRS